MGLKDLFTVKNVLPPISNEQIAEDVESVELLNSHAINKNRIEFAVDYSTASNFAVYGSAEKYYIDSFARIYEQYPYDGSKKEKIDWENSSSLLDVWIYENVYPRTTGYATFSPSGWSSLVGSQVDGYGEPTTKEYIGIKGGPNTNSSTALIDKFKFSNNQNQKANVYNVADSRDTNLNLDLSGGVSLEFWLNKPSFINANTEKEVIFDLWNNTVSSSNSYGRLTLELSGASSGSPFYLTVMSGTDGFASYNIGTNLTTASVTNGWNHYAVTAQNSGSTINVKFYVNGELNFESTNGTSTNPVTGAFLANIGALRTAASGSPATAIGWGKLSGSLDEFRFWKSARTSKDIGRYWWTNVNGGTNSDDANIDLGVYYKFNEGITTTSSVDSIVLDYSGRISNGTWTGYSTSSRNTGSAINEYTVELSPEIPDPIIYATHPDVVEQLDTYRTIGSDHDRVNSNAIYYSFPNWIVEEDQNSHLLNITQIMGSYLDTLNLQIKNFTNIKEPYSNIQIDEKPFPFARNLLESSGLITPNIFIDAKLIEEVLSRNEDRNYEDKLNEVRNIIYENIYSNLQSIYKTKGTEKSFRNMLRCFGIDEKLVKLNIYSNNDSRPVADNLSNITIKKRSINFNDTDRFSSTIYQFSTSSYTDSNSYISGSSAYDYVPLTVEVDTVFPKKLKQNQNEYFPTLFLTSSIFGAHSAKASNTDLTWAANDYFNFQVFAVRPEYESDHATFYLSSSNSAIPTLSSSLFFDVYNNEKWNFSVRIKPDALDNANLVSGTVSGSYSLEFYGVSTIGDSVIREFSSSASISYANGINLTRANKRFYLGAERTNFTGSLIKETDIKILDFKVWSSYLDNEELKSHARDSDNYGVKDAVKSYYLTESGINSQWIPKFETLLLHWNFNQITGSDNGSGILNASDGKFIVNDLTSGSLSYDRYNTQFNTLKKYDYIGRGDFFLQNDTTIIDTQYLFTSRINEFENIQNSNLINILTEDEANQSRLRDTRPTTYFFSFEKSMYGTISEEMLKMFSTILDFNNLVGNPANKYRREYKDLRYLRTLFFQNVQNEPDLDKYLDFYKWIDSALGKLLLQVVPASADTSHGLLNVIENHALTRNKHQYKFPTMEFKEPNLEVGADSINKHLYNWKYGHRPLSNNEDENCLYWNARAERDVAPLSSSVSGTNYTRNQVLSTTLQVLNRSFTTPHRYKVEPSVEIKGGTNLHENANVGFFKAAIEPHGPLDTDDVINVPANILFIGVENTSSVLADCTDVYSPNKKVKYHFTTVQGRDYLSSSLGYGEVLKSDIAIPANFISGNIDSGYNSQVVQNFMSGVIIANLHNDTYGHTKEVPMQGPFTNQWVGGLQSRHVALNRGTDGYTTRPEGWMLLLGQLGTSSYQATLGFVGADYPFPEGNPDEPSYPVRDHLRATYYRDFVAKTPYNIKNIQSSTGSLNLGNYDRKYQYVHTFGKTNNNRLLAQTAESDRVTQQELYGILRTNITNGRVNFTLPTVTRSETIMGSRFSAPGDYRTNSRGYLNLYAEELSPYNALPFRNRTIIGDGRRVNQTLANDSVLYTPEIVSGSNKTLNSLMAIPSAFGGYQSGSTTVASLHKVSRNGGWEVEYSGTTTVVKQQFDNGFYSYAIPKTDSQYAWITASLSSSVKTLPEFQGYLTENIASGSTSYEPTLSLLTQSLIGATGSTLTYGYESASNFVPVDFVGLNTVIQDEVSVVNDELILGSYAEASYQGGIVSLDSNSIPRILNGILLNRNGPYGYPTFKQIRNKNKAINYIDKTNTLNIEANTGTVYNKEPILYYNYPIEIVIRDSKTNTEYVIITSYENIIQEFANPNIKNSIVINSKNKKLTYDNLIVLLGNNKNYDIISLSYTKQVYPKKEFATIDEYKRRSAYDFASWRDSRDDRQQVSSSANDVLDPVTENSIPTQSVWHLDARIDMDTPYLSNSIGGEGVLQNSYSTIHMGTTSSITASVLYAYKHMLSSNRSWTSPSVYSGLTASTTNLTTTNGLFDGTAKWQTGEIAGKNPYYNSYDDWFNQIKFKNKNYQPIPEYVISDNDVKVQAALSLKYNQEIVNSFTLTGSQTPTQIFNAVHLESEDLYNIEKFKKDTKSTTDKINLTLTCDALLKLNPRPSFYPVNRTIDLANYFVQSIQNNITAWTSSVDPDNYYTNADVSLRNILTPTFAPGIMYNTIKSGIAVDFPVLTGSLLTTSSYLNNDAIGDGAIDYKINNSTFDKRLPFETLYDPQTYLKELELIDMNPHPSASLNITASWNGVFDNETYKYAMHNFLSEVVDFFLPEGKLTTLVSAPETEFKKVDPNKEYRALVRLYKQKGSANTVVSKKAILNRISGSDTTTNYPRPQFSLGETEKITMYNRASAFGPPVNGGNTDDDTTGVTGIDSATGYYSPFTPPYYDGEAWVLLTYKPTGSIPYKPTLNDIINNITASYLRYEFNSGTLATSSAPLAYGNLNINSMQASASLNLFNIVNIDQTTLDNTSTNATTVRESQAWAIQTKFETPILNFANNENIAAVDAGNQINNTVGMWHQYGEIPLGKNGVYLQITDIPDNYIKYGSEADERRTAPTGRSTKLTGSLVDIVGFSTDPVKLGQVSDQKVIKEAIVAIPYINYKNQKQYFGLSEAGARYVEFVKSQTSNVTSFDEKVPDTIVNQISLMQEYVLPPQLDFLKNDLAKPISMYIFEFSYTLNQQDLIDIWQGLMPNISINFSEQSQNITHQLMEQELLDKVDITNDLQWLVFKVKKKAKNNYNNKLLQSIKQTSNVNKINKIQSIGRQLGLGLNGTEELEYSYNWPYDFFSLVEVAKIDAKLQFVNNEEQPKKLELSDISDETQSDVVKMRMIQ